MFYQHIKFLAHSCDLHRDVTSESDFVAHLYIFKITGGNAFLIVKAVPSEFVQL